MMAGNGVCLQRIDIRPELELSYSVLLGCISGGMKISNIGTTICVKLETQCLMPDRLGGCNRLSYSYQNPN